MNAESDTIKLHQQLWLRIQKGITNQLDDIIENKIQSIAKKYKIGQKDKAKDKKSPFRNVLAVATDSTASLEVIKTYIQYQVGRKESSPIWKVKENDCLFAIAVIQQIDSLSENVNKIIEEIKEDLTLSKSSLLSYFESIEESPKIKRLKKEIHLQLTQLYLGYLVREHTGQVGLEQHKAQNSKKNN